MPDVLFIKTSSLGDVIHHMPALTEARRQRPDARFCWVVEEAFAPLVQIHPAASDVISVASQLRAAGIETTDAALYPSYAPDYWATFFTDPDGLRLEVTNYRQERRDRHDKWFEGVA